MTDKTTVLSTIWIEHAARYWQSHVRVVLRQVVHDDGVTDYINVELQVGNRWLAMPLWMLDAVISKLTEARKLAYDMAKQRGIQVVGPS